MVDLHQIEKNMCIWQEPSTTAKRHARTEYIIYITEL
jgi:hypothetical protein